MNPRHVVFTDLDGTLIDFETYDGSVTRNRLRELVAAGTIVVFCSSKTLAEQRAWMAELGVKIPAIVENGAGVFIPSEIAETWVTTPAGETGVPVEGGLLYGFGETANKILEVLKHASEQLGIALHNYRALEVGEVAQRTGLDADAAARARERDFSETLTAPLDSATLAQLNKMLEAEGLHAVCGGRFHTVTSRHANKGTAVHWFLKQLTQAEPSASVTTIGIGDAANDLPMLQAVDRPCLVQRPDGRWNDLEVAKLQKIPAIGPQGWLLALADI